MTDHLIAHVISVTTEPEVEYEVASQDGEGNWYTNSGERIWPFWTHPLTEMMALPSGGLYDDAYRLDIPSIPKGWIDHLHAEASRFACSRPAQIIERDLFASLGIKTETITRRM